MAENHGVGRFDRCPGKISKLGKTTHICIHSLRIVLVYTQGCYEIRAPMRNSPTGEETALWVMPGTGHLMRLWSNLHAYDGIRMTV